MLLLSRFIVFGHSMTPAIKDKTSVLISGIPYFFSNPKVGEIIVFKEKKTGKAFLKRIQKIKGNKYFVLGDNKRDSLDSNKIGWIQRKDIVGKVIFRIS